MKHSKSKNCVLVLEMYVHSSVNSPGSSCKVTHCWLCLSSIFTLLSSVTLSLRGHTHIFAGLSLDVSPVDILQAISASGESPSLTLTWAQSDKHTALLNVITRVGGALLATIALIINGQVSARKNCCKGSILGKHENICKITYLFQAATDDKAKHSGHWDQWRMHFVPAHILQ